MKAITSVTETATGLVLVTVSRLDIPGHPSVDFHLHSASDGRCRIVSEYDAETTVRDLFAALDFCLTYDRVEEELKARREANADFLITLACDMGTEFESAYDEVARGLKGTPATGPYLLSEGDDNACRRVATKRAAIVAKADIDAGYTPAEQEEDLVPILATLDLESEHWEGAKAIRRVLQGPVQ
ncbi:MAG: hypothetical protein DRJ42_28105 [Deltaproteobacteria bacterium]|nr:MAG: hypothetical protein DRJ42_28105 [Deltaproteobacteria bacterium]